MSTLIPEIRTGEPMEHEGLRVVPLHHDGEAALDYVLSDEALGAGTAVVEETSEEGDVGTLRIRNDGERPVLFLEGEELRGAKQNRVLNASVLVPADTSRDVPVSCVEEGRWRYQESRDFGSGSLSPFSLRGTLKSSASHSLDAGREARSDQGAVWLDVSDSLSSSGVESPSMAMSELFVERGDELARYSEKLPPPEEANGLAVMSGNRLLGVELFDHPATCRRAWPRLIQAAAADALLEKEGARPESEQQRDEAEDVSAESDELESLEGLLDRSGGSSGSSRSAHYAAEDLDRLLERTRACSWRSADRREGLGTDYRGEPDERSSASLLTYEDRLVHGSVVPVKPA